MPIVLSRVDDRLVHGQVVIGWGRPLGVEFIVLVDEGVAASPWEQDLYRMAVPPELEIRFMTVAEASRRLGEWQAGQRRGVLLTGDIETMAALHRASPAVVRRINLGGIHHRPGRRERLPYLYLTDEELRGLVALEAAGAEVTAQDLPTSSPVTLRSLA
jgi:mannose/fructose/N-acetylgalactosamine-specific phosphotransferase system component IIB